MRLYELQPFAPHVGSAHSCEHTFPSLLSAACCCCGPTLMLPPPNKSGIPPAIAPQSKDSLLVKDMHTHDEQHLLITFDFEYLLGFSVWESTMPLNEQLMINLNDFGSSTHAKDGSTFHHQSHVFTILTAKEGK